MKYEDFIEALNSLPQDVCWYIEHSNFKGSDIRHATVKFDFEVEEKDDD